MSDLEDEAREVELLPVELLAVELLPKEPNANELNPLVALHRSLAELRANGASRYDPSRFHYIESMARQASERRQAVALIIEVKAANALRQYQADFSLARQAVGELVASACATFPEAEAHFRSTFESGDFDGVKRLVRRLQRSIEKKPLLELLSQVSKPDEFGDVDALSFEGLLLQQDAVSSGDSAESTQLTSSEPRSNRVLGELKSIRLFRDSWQKRNSNKRVTQAIKNGPENPGPLNPQMLIIRALATMRDLSPNYLSQFVSYADTLLWLEQADGKPEPDKAQKGRSKTSTARGSSRKS